MLKPPMTLIGQIMNATKTGILVEPFTAEELKSWIIEEKIIQDNGKKYAESSINAILSNSDVKNDPTTNNNKKMLKSHVNYNNKKEYFFSK
ncbi:hypothetical protein [Oceanisphaera sp. IT1-181]|uniref:hypothetical protein n=1 Tax=Oceanisphaera sp. IT1-181 TaxID=3081199 RepID=UPI0029C9C7DF|nr:hypothetical protein [Oceanisphaera sp. IT1-181]